VQVVDDGGDALDALGEADRHLRVHAGVELAGQRDHTARDLDLYGGGIGQQDVAQDVVDDLRPDRGVVTQEVLQHVRPGQHADDAACLVAHRHPAEPAMVVWRMVCSSGLCRGRGRYGRGPDDGGGAGGVQRAVQTHRPEQGAAHGAAAAVAEHEQVGALRGVDEHRAGRSGDGFDGELDGSEFGVVVDDLVEGVAGEALGVGEDLFGRR
jgi:hypothetical protein